MKRTRSTCQIFLVVILSTLCSNILFGQVDSIGSADTSRVQMIDIDHSDRILIVQENGDFVKYIAGNIQLRQDSTYMYCDSAVIFNDNKVFAFDSITIQQGDSLSIFSDTLIYFADTKIANLIGDVVLSNGSQQLWTEELDYNLSTKIASYERGATLYDDSTQLNSISGFFDVGMNQARFKDSVFVIHPDFTLAADSLLYLVEEEKTIFLGPTRILQGNRDIYCESGYYDILNKISEFSNRAQYLDSTKTATADTIRHFQNASIIEMIGHVDFKEEQRIIRSDYLEYNERTGAAQILGNAYYEDEKRAVSADEIFYDTKTDNLQTSGKSHVNEGDQSLSAEDIVYDNETKIGRAAGNVVWKDTASGYVIISDSAIYRKDIEYIEAFGNRKPVLKTEMDGDTLYLAADELNILTRMDTMIVDSTGRIRIDSIRHFEAFYHVQLYKSNLQAVCDSLTYNTRDSLFQFYRNPIVWSDTSQFMADSISMQMKDDKIDRFIMRQNGFIVNQVNNQFYNQIKGKYITAYFQSDEIRRIFVEGNAESVYYPQDEENAFIGVNKSICSEMEFLFAEKKMDTVRFLTAPKSKMSPIGAVDHTTMKLEGFLWDTIKRPQSIEALIQ
jgi:lipopolysaccharide export system protein LptA